ncbi:MAG TPA: hypothetical protein VGX78_04940, partial [Pirellulales bacterium]|nr:hypothetical protein [Pirellulales bacterium]
MPTVAPCPPRPYVSPAPALDPAERRLRDLLTAERCAFDAIPMLQRKFPPAEYLAVVRRTVDAFSPAPACCRFFLPVIDAVQALGRELDIFEAEVARADPHDPSELVPPHPEFWYRRAEAHEAAAKRRPSIDPLPRPSAMIEAGVREHQICTLWRLTKDPTNRAAETVVELLAAELRQPGSIVTPDWIAFVDARRAFEMGLSLAEPRPPKALGASSDVAAGRCERPTIRDLLKEGVPLRQLAPSLARHYATTTESEWDSLLPDLTSMLNVRLFGSASALQAEHAEAEYRRTHDGRPMPQHLPPPL